MYCRQLSLAVWQQAYGRYWPSEEEAFRLLISSEPPEEPVFGDFQDIMDYARAHSWYKEEYSRWLDGPYKLARRRIERAVLRGTMEPWRKIRMVVWERDGHICQVCGKEILYKYYECGHIVDRMLGGSDEYENLVVMCNLCNRLKPLTQTRQEYDVWVCQGGWRGDFSRVVAAYFSRKRPGEENITAAGV